MTTRNPLVQKLSRFLIPLSLFADLLLFFRKPLLDERYLFPWDFPNVQLPLIRFLADQMRKGELAIWDPYTYCGNPIFANIQASLFHPLIFLSALLSNLAGPSHLALLIEWAVVIQIGIAGCACYVLMRSFGVSQAAAWTSAVMCQTGPYFASRPDHIGAMMAAGWAPLAWLSIAILAKRPSARSFAILAVSLAMAVLGGLPAATLAVFVSTVLLALLFLFLRIADFRLLMFTLLGCSLALGLSAIQFIPSVQLTNNSVAKYRTEWLGTGGGLKLQSLVSLISPNHYHIFDLRNFNGPWDPSFLYLYSSALGLILAILAILFIRTRIVYAFTALALFGAFWMLGDSTMLFRLMYPLVPEWIRIGIHPEYTYFIFANCLAVLAGFGLNRFISRPWLQWSIALMIAVDLYLVGSDRPMNCGPGGDAAGISDNAVDQHSELLSKLRLLSAADLPPARIDTMGASVGWAQSAPMTRVPTSSGCSPLAQERIIQVRLGLGEKNGRKSGWYYPVVDPAAPVIDLMGDKYLIVDPSSAPRASANPQLKALTDLAGLTIFENHAALPRAFLVRSVISVDYKGAIDFVRSPKPDFLTRAAVEGFVRIPHDVGPESAGSATFTQYSANGLTLSVISPADAYLVILDAWYPGWTATVDGKATPIYPTDVAFRGLAVPAGRHTVQMKFRPTILIYSGLLSLVSIAIVAIAAIRGRPSSKIR